MIERSCADGGKPSVLTKLCFGCATTYETVHNAVLPRKKELDKVGVMPVCCDAIVSLPIPKRHTWILTCGTFKVSC